MDVAINYADASFVKKELGFEVKYDLESMYKSSWNFQKIVNKKSAKLMLCTFLSFYSSSFLCLIKIAISIDEVDNKGINEDKKV